ncbi:MAG: site-specific integrase, partial [Ignavibacteria bacterium]|nr:site-specific integrase [Ignavibacteria bacterium]
MSIIIRKRKLKHGKIGLYLDIYYKGQRLYETLDLHLTSDKDYNKEIWKLAKKICTQKELEIQFGKYGFPIEKKNINI